MLITEIPKVIENYWVCPQIKKDGKINILIRRDLDAIDGQSLISTGFVSSRLKGHSMSHFYLKKILDSLDLIEYNNFTYKARLPYNNEIVNRINGLLILESI